MTLVEAQAVMIVASLIAMRTARKQGYWLVLPIAFGAAFARAHRGLYHQGQIPGGFAAGSVLLWLGFAPMMRRACAVSTAAVP